MKPENLGNLLWNAPRMIGNITQVMKMRFFGPIVRNHGNLYITLLTLVFGSYGLPHAEVNGTE